MPKYYATIRADFELKGIVEAEGHAEALGKLKEEGGLDEVQEHISHSDIEIIGEVVEIAAEGFGSISPDSSFNSPKE